LHLGYKSPVAPAAGATHSNSRNKDVVNLENGNVIFSVICDLIILGVVSWIGKIRGWSLAAFGIRMSWKETGLGVLLFLAFQLVAGVVRLLMTGHLHTVAEPPGTSAFLRVSHLTVPVIILISIVNPIFEESIESGYFFQTLQRYGPWLTVFAAALFRGFLHLTMGLNGFVTMFAMGLLYGFVYWKWRQLWPLILAHSLQMLYAFLRRAGETTTLIEIPLWFQTCGDCGLYQQSLPPLSHSQKTIGSL
jgi:membrane protease YdiL (CAAX protease family)